LERAGKSRTQTGTFSGRSGARLSRRSAWQLFHSRRRVAIQVDEAYDPAIQSDGIIVVAGSADQDPFSTFAVARYNADGSLDSTFGNGALHKKFFVPPLRGCLVTKSVPTADAVG
jgi:beta-propeller uncharacterized protein DUF5122